MKIVFLDAGTIAGWISLSPIRELGECKFYDYTAPEEVKPRIAGCDVLIINKTKIGPAEIDAAPNLKLIAEAATGVDNVDVKYAASKGIPVRNVAGYSTESVAQITWMHILDLVCHSAYFDWSVKSGKYGNGHSFTDVSVGYYNLRGKKLGIVGLGHIGGRVAEIAGAFGMLISYFPTSGLAHSDRYPAVPLEQLLAENDIISIHCPLNTGTKNLITYNELKLMKKTGYIVNMARGAVVNETDLVRALNEGLIAGAAADVYLDEPIPAYHPYFNVKDKYKLMLTPHVGCTSDESLTTLVAGIATNIRTYFADGK
ncbi:MAG: hydroxyacid dehydrogenase [Bacteroidales bacterium]|jgi:glycerate dehydrogenase|nr:hydroxyacid dehydrogenase [Bacteroidales bacterium]MCI2121819.1 hydroxyacid dehydrogenase [Bacteroidales bacterium]MCI2146050.1 hydroxyacid dehydrogenase [Bacteroidales bacterium]